MKRVALLLIVLTLCACSGKTDTPIEKDGRASARPEVLGDPITLLVLPVERVGALYERYVPLKHRVEEVLHRPVALKVARDYESAIREIGRGEVDMAYLDPAAYSEVRARYKGRVLPLVQVTQSEGSASRSVLVVKGESGIERVADLKGRRLALGSTQSSFSYLVPLALLNDVGIAAKDLAAVELLQQEDRVVLSVLIGNHDAGGISEQVANKYLKDGLKVVKASERLPQFIICASSGMSPELRARVVNGLVVAKQSAALSAEKGIESFTKADDRDVDVIRVMMRNLTGKDYVEYGPRTIRVAILPLYAATTIYERYEPLMRYLSKHTGYELKLVIPRNFEEFMDLVRDGKVDFSYQNPYVFALLNRDVAIQPLVTTVGEDCSTEEGICGEDHFRGVIITRNDSPIRSIRDLRNKRVMIVSPKSAGGYLSQRLFLKERGIDTEKDMRLIDAKKQERVILGVYRGEADAGFVRESAPAVWQDVVDFSTMRVLARTNYLPNWLFTACRSDRPALTQKIRSLLSGLHDNQILQAAHIKGFKEANAREVDVLKDY